MSAARRIAICQHPNGEGVWWETDEANPRCVQDCDCEPAIYVRVDVVGADEVEGLRAELRLADRLLVGHPEWDSKGG